jgi:hypothetical protein
MSSEVEGTPRTQRKKYFSELGALCAFARGIFFPDFVSQIQAETFQISSVSLSRLFHKASIQGDIGNYD